MDNDTWNRLRQQGEADRRNNLPPNHNLPDSAKIPYNKGHQGQS